MLLENFKLKLKVLGEMDNLIENKIQLEELNWFRSLLIKRDLEEFSSVFEPLLKRRIFVTYGSKDDYAQVGNSRLGGWPDVPEDFEWPCCNQGKYLHFVFQLNLADIVSMQSILPSSGVLQFFLGGAMNDETGDHEGRVFYYPETGSLKRPVLQSVRAEDYCWEFYDPSNPLWYQDAGSDGPLLTSNAYFAVFHPGLSLPDERSRFFCGLNDRRFKRNSDNKSRLAAYSNLVYLDLGEPIFCSQKILNTHELLGYVLWAGRNWDSQDMGELFPTGVPKGELLLKINPIQYQNFEHGFLGAMEFLYEFIMPRKNLQQSNFSKVYVSYDG